MNWITTNIRLPEDMYMELKMSAARERKSVVAIIREKLGGDKNVINEERRSLVQKMEKFSRKIAQKSPRLNLTQTVIDHRYQE